MGESLAGRHCASRLHSFRVRELVTTQGVNAAQAPNRLLERRGFPGPRQTDRADDVNYCRARSSTDFVRGDAGDCSGVREMPALRVLFAPLRKRVRSPMRLPLPSASAADFAASGRVPCLHSGYDAHCRPRHALASRRDGQSAP